MSEKDLQQAFAGPAGMNANPGMSIRDYFAAAALTGLCMKMPAGDKPARAKLASEAYALADAMIGAGHAPLDLREPA